MKKALLAMFVLVLGVGACKKDPTTPNNNNNNNNNNNTPTACKDGNVCHKLAGAEVSKPGAGYHFADTFLFVKYEEGQIQLSIDIFGKTTGNYIVGDKRVAGNARIYYYPQNNVTYMSEKGSLNVSAYTSDKKISGTFSGTLYKYDNNNNTFTYSDSMVITDGSFNKVQLR